MNHILARKVSQKRKDRLKCFICVPVIIRLINAHTIFMNGHRSYAQIYDKPKGQQDLLEANRLRVGHAKVSTQPEAVGHIVYIDHESSNCTIGLKLSFKPDESIYIFWPYDYRINCSTRDSPTE